MKSGVNERMGMVLFGTARNGMFGPMFSACVMSMSFSRKIFWVLIGVEIALLLLHVAFMRVDGVWESTSLGYQVMSRFNVDAESSVPTWFAQGLLLVASMALALIGCERMRVRDPFARHWLLLAGLFLYLSVDEAAVLHELWAEPSRRWLSIEQGPLFFAWVVPALGAVALMAGVFFRFLRHLPAVMRYRLVGAAAVFLLGAVGMEMLSGAYWSQAFAYDTRYQLYTLIEEGLEMVAVIIGVSTLLAYIEERKMVAWRSVN